MNEIEIINTAHTDPEVRSLRLSSKRGGDESPQWWRQEKLIGRKEEARQSRQYSKCHSLRSTTSARSWGSHACFATASGAGPS